MHRCDDDFNDRSAVTPTSVESEVIRERLAKRVVLGSETTVVCEYDRGMLNSNHSESESDEEVRDGRHEAVILKELGLTGYRSI